MLSHFDGDLGGNQLADLTLEMGRRSAVGNRNAGALAIEKPGDGQSRPPQSHHENSLSGNLLRR